MKRYLITGAGGSVGSALTLSLLKNGDIVCALDNSEDALFKLKQKVNSLGLLVGLRLFLGDIKDYKRLLMALEGVDTVIHAAALKHVSLCENNCMEAVKTNIEGTQNIIDASLQMDVAKVILTSSDKAVNPTSAMGSTKLVAEKLFSSANYLVGNKNTLFTTIRFGNVWASNGSVGLIFADNVQKEKNLELTSKKMTRFFITIQEAIELCLYAEEKALGGEIFIRNMGCANIHSLAKEFMKYSNKGDIKITGKFEGEKYYEELNTDEEAKRMYSHDKYLIIFPQNLDNFSSKIKKTYQERCQNWLKVDKVIRSDYEKEDLNLIRHLTNKLINQG